MTSTLDFNYYLNIAKQAAHLGGEVLKRYWLNVQDVRDKSIAGDIVTEADKKSEEKILAFLRQTCPTHQILAEESGEHPSSEQEFLWVIDPLDGTVNYAHGFPIVSVSIALLFQQQPVVGVVYNPLMLEMFHAVKGKGTCLNEEAIRVSSVGTLERSLLATGFPYDRLHNKDNNYTEFMRLTDHTQGVRRAGSAALDLAYVAAGRFDGYWERGIQPWDVAAGVLLVQEAGGMVTGYDKSPFDLYGRKVLATNGKLHTALSEMLCMS